MCKTKNLNGGEKRFCHRFSCTAKYCFYLQNNSLSIITKQAILTVFFSMLEKKQKKGSP